MLVNPESMPDWISWSHWLSIFFYAYSALMINELTGIKIDFAVGGGGGGGGHSRPLLLASDSLLNPPPAQARRSRPG
jgi:hypothetical protein